MYRARTVLAAVVAVASIAASLVTASPQAVAAESGAEYCRLGITRWTYTIYTMHVRSSIPASFNSSITSAMRQWSGIPGSALRYYGPQFRSGVANPEYLLYLNNFANSGLPDVPGITLGVSGSSGTHRTAEVLLNSRFSWNTAGTMNQAQRRVDVWTIAVHEMGHASGLAHPYSNCGPVTAAERASVMYVNWTRKRVPNSDDRAGIAAIY
ncbi:matrixin family metalloprotease [Kribbella sp. NPDC059898]|uniref:matrixin family metalloprotease n=1 Tax=Kribbella sp. NPDC059898 TaxID=3346995 RepID=UPI003656BB0A